MNNREVVLRRTLGLTIALVLCMGCTSAGKPTVSRSDEMREGYRAARRGYWQEALMRFERARSLAPNDADVLNNVAVALEAVGRYDEAGKVYEEALRIKPGDGKLKKNQRLFKDFYASYIAEDRQAKDHLKEAADEDE